MVTRKCLKISCAVSVILLLIIVGVMLILYFTILKPKDPILIPQSVFLKHLHADPTALNFTLEMTITVDNRNYGGFKYHNATSYITYRGIEVGDGLLGPDTIPARAKHNISTSVDFDGDRLVTNIDFLGDLLKGVVNFTASTTLNGKVEVLKIIKKKATSYTICDISVNRIDNSLVTVCHYKLKF